MAIERIGTARRPSAPERVHGASPVRFEARLHEPGSGGGARGGRAAPGGPGAAAARGSGRLAGPGRCGAGANGPHPRASPRPGGRSRRRSSSRSRPAWPRRARRWTSPARCWTGSAAAVKTLSQTQVVSECGGPRSRRGGVLARGVLGAGPARAGRAAGQRDPDGAARARLSRRGRRSRRADPPPGRWRSIRRTPRTRCGCSPSWDCPGPVRRASASCSSRGSCPTRWSSTHCCVEAQSGELARTLEAVDGVVSARVHLVRPQPTRAGTPSAPTKAAVYLRVQPAAAAAPRLDA